MSGLLLAVVLVPLLLAPLVVHPAWRWLVLIAPLPALASLALLPPDATLELPWLLLGTALGLDETTWVFLLFTTLVWSLAAVPVVERLGTAAGTGRFRLLFLLALAGNLWLILAREPVGFYVGFAIMGLAAYGLILHPGGLMRRRAGRVYLAMTLIGELALFVALLLMAQTQGVTWSLPATSAPDGTVIALLLLGLGIKAGLMPLHPWLPLAYGAAPAPAAAVLSGAMSKVALLGWLRLLPLGQVALPEWGMLFVWLGLVSLLVALGVGLVQTDPRRVLAYSSISKAGLFVLLLGLLLLEPTLTPIGVGALTLYAAHHALVKSGLFLGLGLRDLDPARPLVRAGLILLALALAGAPLTSGALAKSVAKPVLVSPGWIWLDLALMLATVATMLLMARFVWLIWPAPGVDDGHRGALPMLRTSNDTQAPVGSQPAFPIWSLAAWILLLGLVAGFPFVLGEPSAWPTNAGAMLIAGLIAAPLALAIWRRAPGSGRRVRRRSLGDLVVLIEPILAAQLWTGRALFGRWNATVEAARAHLYSLGERVGSPPPDPERTLRAWPTAGWLWLGVTVLLLLLVLVAP
ncbi:proton-conducting transporter membrane subunit [Allochromatium palmeri]|nr:proton-conducting transporter membrane subunit [Allochromatium palmeri]